MVFCIIEGITNAKCSTFIDVIRVFIYNISKIRKIKEVRFMILTAKYTDQGGRELNEDSHGIFVKNGCICAVVADGVGGHGGGDKASGLAVRGTNKLYQNSQEDLPINEINSWVQQINQAVCQMQTAEC